MTKDVFIIYAHSFNGVTPLSLAFLDETVATLHAKKLDEEWTNHTVKPAKLRMLTETEGAIGNILYSINSETADEVLKQNALNKLTIEERKLLKL